MNVIRFCVIADPHYYSPRLGITGSAYTMRSESDQKVLAESGAVLKSALDDICASDAQFILIAGDVTNNGECVSHEEFRDIVRKYQTKKPIYLITSTHDWCSDENPRRYDGDSVFRDVPCLSMPELTDFYREFGLSEAIAVYTTAHGNASYAVCPCAGLTVLCLNDDDNGDNGSGFSDEHIEWIAHQCHDARKRGDNVIGMNHHHYLLTALDKAVSGKKSVEYKTVLAAKVAEAGLNAVFVGHSHMQHITKFDTPSGDPFYEINVASICGYPAPMAYCAVEDGILHIDVKHQKSFVYADRTYTADYLRDHATNLITKIVKAAADNKPEEFAALVASVGMGQKKAKKVWKLARYPLKKLSTATVEGTARLLNTFTFGKAIDKKAAKAMGSERVLDVALGVFLSVFDGGITVCDETAPRFRVVSDALSLPLRAVRFFRIKNGGLNRTLTYLNSAASPLLKGGDINANHADIPLKTL